MKHAFAVNCHRDLPQFLRLARILREVFPESGLVGYFDGPGYEPDSDFKEAKKLCSLVEWRNYEPDKPKSLVQALSATMSKAWAAGYQAASFLHADMVPTDREQFHRFIDRFLNSGKALVSTSMWPMHAFIDYCNLHFHLPRAFDLGLLPLAFRRETPDCNEASVTRRWEAVMPGWNDEAYHVWTMVWPIACTPRPDPYGGTAGFKMGHGWKWWFKVHNYTPESSVIHTDDETFWSNAREICRW